MSYDEKRFENRLNKDVKKFVALNPVWDNENEDAYNVFEMICLMNKLNDENKRLQESNISKRNRMRELLREKFELKRSSKMYYNLFRELQNQLKGVKKLSDLDHKDFEDLIQLSKGMVFDDRFGWIHLPVKELEE